MKRIFLGWDGPALPRAARELVDHYLRDGIADLRPALVVVPGARAGRRLKELLVEEAAGRGARLLPPEVTTVGHLPERLFESPLPLASAVELRLAWAVALRETPRARLEKLYGRIPSRGALSEWVALAAGLGSLHRSVGEGGWDFSDVVRRAKGAADSGRLTWDDAERWRVLAEVQDRVRERLAGLELADPDLARIAALREERVGVAGERDRAAGGDIWLVGVSDLPGVVRRFLIAVSPRVRCLVHAPEEEADGFDEWGCVREQVWAERAVDLPDDILDVRDRPGDQADAVVECLAGLATGRSPDEVVIGAPDQDAVPWIQERLAMAGPGARDAAGDELRGTGPYRLLAAVGELLGERRFESFAALIRHPDVDAWLKNHGEVAEADPEARHQPGGWLGRLDAWYGAHLPDRVPLEWGRRGFQGRKGDHGAVVAELFEAVGDRLIAELDSAPDERPIGEWVAPVLELLTRVYGEKALDTSDRRGQRLARALGRLGAVVQGFVGLDESLDLPCSASVAIGIFLRQAAAERIPADPDREAIEIVGWLELQLDDAPIAVLTGVNGPFLPESVEGDPFLPDALRAELALVDNRLRYARDAYRLTAMLHAREALRLVSGRRSSANDPLRPSRLLFAESDDTRTARRILQFFGDGEETVVDGEGGQTDRAEGPTGSEGAVAGEPSATISGFRLPPENPIRFEPPARLRVTDFRGLIQDPWGWVLQRRLRHGVIDDEAREMDGALFGSVAHRVLERFGTDLAVESTDPIEVRAALDRLLDEEVEMRFGADARFSRVAVRIQLAQLRSRLAAFADWQAARRAAGWEVQGVEMALPEDGARFEVDGVEIGITGTLDRVDYHPATDCWALFDYKTGDRGDDPVKTHRQGKKPEAPWIDLQLPLYRHLIREVLDADGDRPFEAADPTRVEVGYIVLPRDLSAVGARMAEWDDEEFEDAIETAREVVRAVRAGVVDFDPEVRPAWPDPRVEALAGRGLFADAGDEEGGDD